MNNAMLDNPLKFKFRYVNNKGQARGLLYKNGMFDGDCLRLAKNDIPIAMVFHALNQFGHVVIAGMSPTQGEMMLAIHVAGGKKKSRALVAALNQACSKHHAHQRAGELAARGQSDDVRSEVCPNCGATIDLSCCPASPQSHCPYCDVIAAPDTAPVEPDARLRICPECGLFADARHFTVFYFYFLVYIFGYRQQLTYRCSNCMKPDAWKMLLFNALFVIGLPVALVQLARCYFGGSKRSKNFRALNKANALAAKGRSDRASSQYQQMEQHLTHCAGVRFNHGLAWMRAGKEYYEKAAECFLAALADCSNYVPALNALCQCYDVLGMTNELEQVKQIWRLDDRRPMLDPAKAAPSEELAKDAA